MDIYMPEVDGTELTSIIREETDFARPHSSSCPASRPGQAAVGAERGRRRLHHQADQPKHLVSIVTNRIRRRARCTAPSGCYQAEDIDRLGRLVRERVFFDRHRQGDRLRTAAHRGPGLALRRARSGHPPARADRHRRGRLGGGAARQRPRGELGPQTSWPSSATPASASSSPRRESDVRPSANGCARVAATASTRTRRKGITSAPASASSTQRRGSVGLITRASVACASAADAGGTDPTIAGRHRLAASAGHRRAVHAVAQALADDRFEPQFQAMLDVSNSTRDHFEMTLRLRGPEATPSTRT